MTFWNFIWRSIIYFRRQQLALFFGMATGAMVLTGALIVGDSIRYSLNSLVETRLGRTQFAIMGGSRFMGTALAGKLEQAIHVPAAPVLMLKGIAIHQESGRRINNVVVIGIDSSWSNIARSPVPVPLPDEVIVGSGLADRLKIKSGDELLIRVGNVNLIPVNAPFAREPEPSVALRLTVKAIVTDNQLGRFNLANNQTNAYNAFVNLGFLGRRLDLDGLINTILVAGTEGKYTAGAINDSLQSVWSLKDLGLSFKSHDKKGNYDLVSDRIFIDSLVPGCLSRTSLPYRQVITYLINDIGFNSKHTPYSFGSGVSPSLSPYELNESEVLINQWTAADLGAKAGDSVLLKYFVMGRLRDLHETSRKFIIKNIIPDTTIDIDSTLMPGYPGLSGVADCRHWDAGVPIDLKRIRDKDEKYWNEYRGTPKVIMSLKTGEKIWKNPFGTVTALRFRESEVSKSQVEAVLLKTLKPSDLGFTAVDMRKTGNLAARNAVNFTELFLGMSFFIIVAGVLLTLLIYSLHFSQRSAETAILAGLGYKPGQIIRMRFAEASLVIIAGSIMGSLLGILYNYGLMAGLNSVWNDMVRTDLLSVHVTFTSLLVGTLSSIIVAVLPMYLLTSRRLHQPIALSLNNVAPSVKMARKKGWSLTWGTVLTAISLLIVLYALLSGAYNSAALYLTSAGLFLAGTLWWINGMLKNYGRSTESVIPSTGKIALRNLRRNPARSLSVIALLALGTFTLAITGAYRRTFYGAENLRSSGTGGYLLWAETTNPIPFNLNSDQGKSKLLTDSVNELGRVRFLQFETLSGDDASCLNLNQVQQPRLLAVNPEAFDSSGAFSFVKVLSSIPGKNPWQGLESTLNDSTYPAYADQEVIQYSLQKKLGDTLIYQNEDGKAFRLLLAGALDNSIFQGYLLVSDKLFRKQYPSSGGSSVMLVDAPYPLRNSVMEILSQSLVDYGIDVVPTSQRLALFNSVQNTYLTVFMALSGLGFILGTIGLGIILLRNIFERKRELALLVAIGYRRGQLFRIVFTENLYLLIGGFGIGLLAALIGILPSLISPSFKIQGYFLWILTACTFASGLVWIYFPMRSALNKPLVPSLRND